MSRGFPSMTALLGLLAVAGYQNRDKIAEMLNGLGGAQGAGGMRLPGGQAGGMGQQGGGMGQQGGAGNVGGLGGLGGLLGGLGGGATAGGLLSGGLGELVDRFKQAGQGEAADSWISTGPNRELPPPDLERAIGSDTLATLSQQTGLSREELLARLSRELPQAVDRYTPDGRLPT
ncbi:YidB family protein [Enterovirga sp.]|jgi:uncharacterized protein YidB (DUF937 family)|uniref:YidB family protein n=1 Tax=Enterovirga sp. TaxID=2026350 RepID=UPI00261994A6|nr:YidB family protein [Enterovirga sp.]MDB5590848.1 hypothetical protein [Enterovirga sp.]